MAKKFSCGFRDFVIKSVIFIVLFLLVQVATMWLASETRLPSEIKPFAMDDLAEAVFFMLILFIAVNKGNILKIKQYSVRLKQRILSIILVILLFTLYFKYKGFLLNNIDLVKQYLYFFSFI